jgi:tetratricopeptide (TPR) repeat protein
MSNQTKWIAIILCGLIIGGGAFWYVRSKTAPPPQPDYTKVSATDFLLQNNPDFAAAYRYQSQGNYAMAKQSYEAALANTSDNVQELQIDYYIATMDASLGNFTEAIELLKQIVANVPRNWQLMAAYAVQEMTTIHYQNPSNGSITQDIFRSQPYSALYSATSTDEANYRNLLQFGANLYPLGITEARLAYAYSQDLQNDLHGATSTPAAVAKIAQINGALNNANAFITDTQNNAQEINDVPTIATYQGMAIGYLATVGLASPQDAENAFKQALQYMEASGQAAGQLTNIQYAAFLQQMYGQSRISDIKELLKPFVANAPAGSIYAAVGPYLLNLRTDPDYASQRRSIVNLALIDSSFESYLLSIGWQQNDFAQS